MRLKTIRIKKIKKTIRPITPLLSTDISSANKIDKGSAMTAPKKLLIPG